MINYGKHININNVFIKVDEKVLQDTRYLIKQRQRCTC